MLQGKCDLGFEPLARAFEESLSRPPFGGAALSVYHGGRSVFDMWGGPRDNAQRPWEERTPAVSFSTTKGVAATAIHILADRGQLDYDQPVARYWPEFKENGKERVTVRQVLTHSAGLYDARNLLERADDLLDWDTTIAALERAPLEHAPGRFHAYHALTYGHLLGELVRRVSGKRFSRFIADEIAAPLGLQDFFVGAPDEAIARAARIILTPRPTDEQARARRKQARERRLRHMRALAQALKLVSVPMDLDRIRDAFSPKGIGRWDFSSPEVLRACIPAANGLFTARDLARMYAALAEGGSLDGARLMSERTLREATAVQRRGPDGVLVVPMGWRLGYHSVFTTLGPVRGAFGHAGYNGSGAWASPRHHASFAYVVNAGSGSPVGDMRLLRLSGIALSCLRARKHAAA